MSEQELQLLFESSNQLPDDLLDENTIEKMADGQVGYTVPWAMFANLDRRLFIVGTYNVYPKPGGTLTMKIQRFQDGVLVDKSSIQNERYTPKEPGYVGVTERDFIPVRLVPKIQGQPK